MRHSPKLFPQWQGQLSLIGKQPRREEHPQQWGGWLWLLAGYTVYQIASVCYGWSLSDGPKGKLDSPMVWIRLNCCFACNISSESDKKPNKVLPGRKWRSPLLQIRTHLGRPYSLEDSLPLGMNCKAIRQSLGASWNLGSECTCLKQLIKSFTHWWSQVLSAELGLEGSLVHTVSTELVCTVFLSV